MRGRSPQREDDAPAERPRPTAKALAVRWLAQRDLSRAELSDRLRRRGVEESEIERTLDDLAALGYLSDARFAHAVVAQRTGRYGKRAIVHALSERGIAGDTAQAALAQLEGRDEREDAHALWMRRFGRPPRDEREKARHVRFLQSRGFSLSVALAVLRRAGAAESESNGA